MARKGIQISALALAGLSLFAGSANALEMDLGKSSMTASIGGLLQHDASYFVQDDELKPIFKNEATMRRMDLSIYGEVGKMRYKVGMEKTLVSDDLLYNDAYVSYVTNKGLVFGFGWMQPVFGLENSSSTAYINSLEKSLTGQLFRTKPHRGVSFGGNWGPVSLHTNVFVLDRDPGYVLESTTTLTPSSAFEYGFSGRATIMLRDNIDCKAHIGASFYAINPNAEWDGNVIHPYPIVEPNYKDIRGRVYLDNFGLTGMIVDKYHNDFSYPFVTGIALADRTFVAGEALLVRGKISASLEGFYSKETFDVANAKTDAFAGFNAEIAWVVTGESREYNSKNRTIGGITPNGKKGAVEVFARLSYLDMNGDNIKDNTKITVAGRSNGLSTYNVEENLLSGESATAYSAGVMVIGLQVQPNDLLASNDSKDVDWMSLWSLSTGANWYLSEYAVLKVNAVLTKLPKAITKKVWGSTNTTRYMKGFGARAQISW